MPNARLLLLIVAVAFLITVVIVPPSCDDESLAVAGASIGDEDMVIIEAAIAYKKQEVPKQPQKQRSARRKKLSEITVSRDAERPVAPEAIFFQIFFKATSNLILRLQKPNSQKKSPSELSRRRTSSKHASFMLIVKPSGEGNDFVR